MLFNWIFGQNMDFWSSLLPEKVELPRPEGSREQKLRIFVLILQGFKNFEQTFYLPKNLNIKEQFCYLQKSSKGETVL